MRARRPCQPRLRMRCPVQRLYGAWQKWARAAFRARAGGATLLAVPVRGTPRFGAPRALRVAAAACWARPRGAAAQAAVMEQPPGGPPRAPGFYWPALTVAQPNAAAMAQLAAMVQLPHVGGWTPAASLLPEQAVAAVSEPSGDAGAPRKVRRPARDAFVCGGGALWRAGRRSARVGRRPFPSIA